jgi:branched-chain amino acid transport system ATP-binding protein
VNGVSFSVEPGEIFGIAGPERERQEQLFNLISGIPFGHR